MPHRRRTPEARRRHGNAARAALAKHHEREADKQDAKIHPGVARDHRQRAKGLRIRMEAK